MWRVGDYHIYVVRGMPLVQAARLAELGESLRAQGVLKPNELVGARVGERKWVLEREVSGGLEWVPRETRVEGGTVLWVERGSMLHRAVNAALYYLAYSVQPRQPEPLTPPVELEQHRELMGCALELCGHAVRQDEPNTWLAIDLCTWEAPLSERPLPDGTRGPCVHCDNLVGL